MDDVVVQGLHDCFRLKCIKGVLRIDENETQRHLVLSQYFYEFEICEKVVYVDYSCEELVDDRQYADWAIVADVLWVSFLTQQLGLTGLPLFRNLAFRLPSE
ncbi:hypothetical protein RB195_010490 [Necator americanus]|uniref:Uncharacterized protein n=1 Tax=Necator americanus TaxID=51031 RepID=A0ABR1CZA2_NECAM